MSSQYGSIGTTGVLTGFTTTGSTTVSSIGSSLVLVQTPTLPPFMDHLEADQMLRVEALLQEGRPLTNFEIQRTLFNGNLNKEAALAIKRHVLNLVAQGKCAAEGNKRGRRYTWIG